MILTENLDHNILLSVSVRVLKDSLYLVYLSLLLVSFLNYHNITLVYLYYLENHHADNVPILMELYLETDSMEIRHHLKYYFENFKMYSDIISYNLSRKIANQLIHKNIK